MKHLFEEMYVKIQHLTLLEWLAINLHPKILKARKLTLYDFYSVFRGTFHSRSFHQNLNPLPQTWGPRAFFLGGIFSVLTGSVVNSFDSKCLVGSIPASICQFVWSGWFFSRKLLKQKASFHIRSYSPRADGVAFGGFWSNHFRCFKIKTKFKINSLKWIFLLRNFFF